MAELIPRRAGDALRDRVRILRDASPARRYARRMVRILIRLAVFLGTAALAIFLAALLVPGFHVEFGGFILAVIVFAVVQTFLAWLVERIFEKSAPTVAGIAGLLSTGLALWLATIFPGGLRFDGIGAWILAAVVVWLVTAIIGWAVAKFILKKPEAARR